jgi:hypothetical protein
LASSRCTNKSIAKKIPHEKCDKNWGYNSYNYC